MYRRKIRITKLDVVVTALIMLFAILSLGGIPPTAGFFGKFFIFMAALNQELYTLVVIGAITSVIGAYYYLRIIKLMYFDPPGAEQAMRPGQDLRLVLSVNGLLV